MKNNRFIISALAVIFSLAVFVSGARAEEMNVEKQNAEVGRAVVVAEVNIHNAKIVSQDKNKIKVSFNLDN